ncbi:MAG: hypothetical protein GY852_11305 [bacterium]|nr:hypothetical protein [bacterium]
MANQDQTYRSLVMRKVQQLAKEHGGLAKIPKSIQQKLDFEVIAKRRGAVSVSVTIPPGNLSGKISQLQADLPAAKAFGPSKPAPDPFRKYTPVASQTNQTMDDFWIAQGWYKQDRIGIKLTLAKWKGDPWVRTEAVKFLVEKVLKKDPRDITQNDFTSNRLGGLINHQYKGSPYKALVEAGYAHTEQEALNHAQTGNFQSDKIYSWEMAVTPRFYFESKDNRVAATKWLMWKIKKQPTEIMQDDFHSNRLGGHLNEYGASSYLALVEAGYAYSIEEMLEHAKAGNFQSKRIYPWEMACSPEGFFNSKENRVAATKWLLWKIGKPPESITRDPFYTNSLVGLMGHYNSSPYLAFVEAGYAYSIEEMLGHAKTGNFQLDKLYPWKMSPAPQGFHQSKENRVAATKWLLWKTGKPPESITVEDFQSNNLYGLLLNKKGDRYALLVEAGYAHSLEEMREHAKTGVFKTGKIYPWQMDISPQRFYQSEHNRIAATKWLIWKTRKHPREIIQEDFVRNDLHGLLGHHSNSPYSVLLEAGYAYSVPELLQHAKAGTFHSSKIYPWELSMTPREFYGPRENRVAAMRWMAWKLQKDPKNITNNDFEQNDLRGIMSYYNSSPYKSLLDAGLVSSSDEEYMRSYGRARFMEATDQ